MVPQPSPSTPARAQRRGVVTAEYLLLVTVIGIGVLVGLATLRNAIVDELTACANAVKAIIP